MENKKKRIFNKLYWQISAIFIVVLLIFAFITIYVSVHSANKYSLEVTQQLNRKLAENTAFMMKPHLENGTINQEGLKDLLHSMMVINPSIEIYILDKNGYIQSFVAPEKVVKLEKVSLDPIRQFLSFDSPGLVYGDDPRNPGEKKIFSATPIVENRQLSGYIYIVLASQEYVSASHMVIGSYILGLSIRSVIAILIISTLVGLLALWFIMKRLNLIIDGIKQFQLGKLDKRIPVKSDGELDKIGIVFNDMADTIKKNIEELQGIDNLRSELISNISHDLRTPIASIQGYAETLLLKNDDVDSEHHRQYLEIIFNSCEKLKKLVSNLFELSKLQADQVKLNKEPFSVAELVHDIANKYRLISEKKGISINTIVSKNIPIVEADISMIDRVLQNLIDNAIRYCKEGDVINLDIETEDDKKVRITVSDTGEGISQDRLSHIFERYFKSSGNEESTGLGLAIVKKIIDLHKSTIQVQSTLGKGTRFIFDLPVI